MPKPNGAIRMARKRAVAARTLIALARGVFCEMQPALEDTRVGANLDRVFIYGAVLIGHVEARPRSATKISALLEMPRTNVVRGLDQLMKAGVVVRRGFNFQLSELNVGDRLDCVAQSVRAIKVAAVKVSE